MKFTILALAFLASATAFSPLKNEARTMTKTTTKAEAATLSDVDGRPLYDPLGLYPKNSPERMAGLIIEEPLERDQTVIDPMSLYPNKSEITSDVQMSASLPFVKRPAMLDGSLPGDRGFDPFNFSSSPLRLQWYRNAELKHARLAMLAAVGWPIAELFHNNLASSFDLDALLSVQDRVPSVLNGGLSNVSPVFWVAALGAAAALEGIDASKERQSSEVVAPGDLGFDPLGLAGSTESQTHFMQEAELFNGRLGMLAITGFAIQEWWNQASVVNDMPIFFKPLNVAFEQLMDAGAKSL